VRKLNNNIHYDGTTEMNSNNMLLQQDGAPSHTATHHQLPAERKESAIWPANSPNLNLVNYAVCGALQQRVYCDDCLKLWNSWNRQSWMVDECCMLSQKFIDRSISEWRRRQKCVVQQKCRMADILNIF